MYVPSGIKPVSNLIGSPSSKLIFETFYKVLPLNVKIPVPRSNICCAYVSTRRLFVANSNTLFSVKFQSFLIFFGL
jgi:hypothetical protein